MYAKAMRAIVALEYLLALSGATMAVADITTRPPLWLLVSSTEAAIAVTSLVVARTTAQVVHGVEDAVTLNEMDQVGRLLERGVAWQWFQSAAIVANYLAEAASAILAHQYRSAAIDIVWMLLFLWIIRKNNKSGRDAATKLIGEKSRALRQKLVDSMPAPSPVAGPAWS